MAAKKKTDVKKEPAGAGDIGKFRKSVTKLIADLTARKWLAALQDVQDGYTELMLGLSDQEPAMLKLEKACADDCCSDEALECLCECLDEKCQQIDECKGDEKKLAKLSKAEPAGAGGMLLGLFGPLLLKAMEAIIAGLLKQKQEKPE